MTQEVKAMFLAAAKRFLRAFVAGGVSSLATIFAVSQFNMDTLKDPGTLAFSLIIAFVSGGLQAIDKLLRYVPDNNQ